MTVKKWIIATVAAIVIASVAYTSLYVVDLRNFAIITQFGKVVATRTEPGLYFKIPAIQTVLLYDKRLREWDGEPSDLLTVDKENIEVNTWARWRVVDPQVFYEALRTENGGQGVLDGRIDSSVKNVISARTLMEVLRNTHRTLRYTSKELQDSEASRGLKVLEGREKIVAEVLENAGRKTKKQYGFIINGIGIKHFNYVRAVIPKIYDRMASERDRIANRYESEGREREARIVGGVAKDLERIASEGYRDSMRIRGEAEAQAIKIYADAYNRDPEFYSFNKSLSLLPKTMGKDTRLVLSAGDSALYKYLGSFRKSQK
jgi:modulator of FtsH protease HflC